MFKVEKEAISHSAPSSLAGDICAFMDALPSIIHTHRNEFALIRDGNVVRYYLTHWEAQKEAKTFYFDDRYLIAKVRDNPEFTYPSYPLAFSATVSKHDRVLVGHLSSFTQQSFEKQQKAIQARSDNFINATS